MIEVAAQSAGETKSKHAKCEARLDTLTNKKVFLVSDISPEPEGGMMKLFEQLGKEIRFPPEKIQGQGIPEGKLFFGFVVDVDGSILGKRILKGDESSTMIEQVFDVISSIKWSPGYCNNEAVPFMMILPVVVCFR